MTTFYVPGLPQPQGSARAFVVKGRAVVTSDNPKMKSWRMDVKTVAYQECTLLEGPVQIDAGFYLPRPKSHYGTGRNAAVLKESAPALVSSKPDIDKLSRALLDALTGIAYRDDAQVVRLSVVKRYAEQGAGTFITVEGAE